MPDEAEALIAEWNFDLEAEGAMPRLISLLFFEYVNGTPDGKLNLLGVFDRLFVDEAVKKTIPIGVFVRTAATFDEPIFVTIVSPPPDAKPVGGFNFQISKQDVLNKVGEDKKHIMFQLMAHIQFDAPVSGTYWFNVAFAGKSIGGSPLAVELRSKKEIENGVTRGNG